MAAVQTTINFDDIFLTDGSEARIPNGYQGFNWIQAGVHNPINPSGYTPTSGSNLAFIAEASTFDVAGYEDAAPGSPFVMTRSTAFDLVGADFSAGFREGVSVTVRAYADEAGTQPIGSLTFTVGQGSATGIDFDSYVFGGAKRVEFNANDRNPATSDYFGIDDIVVRDAAPATIVTFDEFRLSNGGEQAVPDGYVGFDWSGVGVYRPDGGIRGYQTADGTANLGFIGEANGLELAGYEDHAAGTAAVITRDEAFTFRGGAFSSAFRDDLAVTVRAYADADGTELIGTASFELDRGVHFVSFSDDPATAGGQRLFLDRGIQIANTVQNVDIDGTFAGAHRIEFASNDGNPSTADYFGFDSLAFI